MKSIGCVPKVVPLVFFAWCLLDGVTLLEECNYGTPLQLTYNCIGTQHRKLNNSSFAPYCTDHVYLNDSKYRTDLGEEQFLQRCVCSKDLILGFPEIQSTADVTKSCDYLKDLHNKEPILERFLEEDIYITFFKGIGPIHSNTEMGTITSFDFSVRSKEATRLCEIWLKFSNNALNGTRSPERTCRLRRVAKEQFILDAFANIRMEIDDFQELTAVDVNVFSKGLKTMSVIRNISHFKHIFFQHVNSLMQINSGVLRESQKEFNSTDKILDSIENFVANIADDVANLTVITQPNLISQITSPFINNIIGLAIYGDGYSDFSNYKIVNLYWNETFDNLNLENLELAVYIPTDYIQNLTATFGLKEKRDFKIINTVFYNDGFFKDFSDDPKPIGSRIISVNIPTLSETDVPVRLLFKPISTIKQPTCAFWDYGQKRHGEWSANGGEYIGLYQNEQLIQCSFTHITHFGLLVLGENTTGLKNENEVNKVVNSLGAHELVLNLITSFGCGLSMAGLLAILATALSFKDWYKKRLNTIQLGISMFMEIILLYLADWELFENDEACVKVAAVLHYVVLSKFFWMLIIARIQYLKYVRIFDCFQDDSNVIIHTLVGWLTPAALVVLGLFFFPNSYRSGNLHFCYVKDNALYFFVIAPISAIVLINIAIFASVMATVSNSKAHNAAGLQSRLGIMLLFMLGIMWLFGLMAEFLPYSLVTLICLYIFCVLGSLQGYTLFVFTVLLDKYTVDLWTGKVKDDIKSWINYNEKLGSQTLQKSVSYEWTMIQSDRNLHKEVSK